MDGVTFKHISERDLMDAEYLLKGARYSSASRYAQQAVEKRMKHYIKEHGDSTDSVLLTSHNTVKLYDRVVALGGVKGTKEQRMMMSVLKDYYFDMNYPGSDYRDATAEEAEDAVEFAKEFISQFTDDVIICDPLKHD